MAHEQQYDIYVYFRMRTVVRMSTILILVVMGVLVGVIATPMTTTTTTTV